MIHNFKGYRSFVKYYYFIKYWLYSSCSSLQLVLHVVICTSESPTLFISSRGICGASPRLESPRPAMGLLGLSGLCLLPEAASLQSPGCEKWGPERWPPVAWPCQLLQHPACGGGEDSSQRDSQFSLHQSHGFCLASGSAMLCSAGVTAGSWPLLGVGPSAESKGLGATWPKSTLSWNKGGLVSLLVPLPHLLFRPAGACC